MLTTARRKLLLSFVLALAVVLGLLLYADVRSVTRDFLHFQWSLLPAIVALSLVNYGLRFLKWQYFLRLIAVHGISRTDSLLIYLSGFSLTLTPAKLGEWLKSYLLLRVGNVPIARSAPVLVAERLTDGLALACLAVGGVAAFSFGREILLASVVVVLIAVVAVRFPPLTRFMLGVGRRLPVVGTFADHFDEAIQSLRTLLSLRSLVLGTAIGFISWGAECVAFMLVLVGLGVTPSVELLFHSMFILPIASLAGAVLFLPGGLGAVEGGIAGLTQAMVGLSRSQASVAALVIRLATLWFAIGLGAIAFVVFTGRLRGLNLSESLTIEPERTAAGAATDS